MKAAACLLVVLSALLTVQPLVTCALEKKEARVEKSCCNKTKQCHPRKAARKEQQKSEDKDCCTRNGNPFAGCAASQYLPAEKPGYHDPVSLLLTKFPFRYTELIVPGYTSDCWQPPERLFV